MISFSGSLVGKIKDDNKKFNQSLDLQILKLGKSNWHTSTNVSDIKNVGNGQVEE